MDSEREEKGGEEGWGDQDQEKILFIASAVNEEGSERDRGAQVSMAAAPPWPRCWISCLDLIDDGVRGFPGRGRRKFFSLFSPSKEVRV